jgi:hypothetical protein
VPEVFEVLGFGLAVHNVAEELSDVGAIEGSVAARRCGSLVTSCEGTCRSGIDIGDQLPI